jgi:hypothetical protein
VPFVIPSDNNAFVDPNKPIYQGSCWKRAYSRGVGKAIHSCPEGYEKQGLLCYPICKEGYTGFVTGCYQNCPLGWQDTGLICQKPSSYNRREHSSQMECELHVTRPCEQVGDLWYPPCNENFVADGCCLCVPKCPEGMVDWGQGCAKGSFERGWGEPMTCAPYLE